MAPRIALVSVGPLSAWCKSPNFGLLYIAACLQRDLGIDPTNIVYADQCAGDDVLEVLSRKDWDVVGFSSSSIAAHELNTLVPEVRRRWPDRLTVLGGVHVSALPELALRQSQAHFGITNEGEAAFSRLVSLMDAPGAIAESVPGLVCLDDGRLNVSGLPIEPIADLDSLPPLALGILNRQYYFENLVPIPGTPIGAFPWMTSRGCVFRCRFCCVNVVCGGTVRYHSAARVLDDLERLVRDYDVPAIMFVDDNLVADRDRLEEICAGILKSPRLRGLKWACNARADRVDVDILSLMKGAGCVQVAFGFESASQRILTYLKKGPVSVEDARLAIGACKKAGVRVQGMFMLGSPGETREDVETTLSFIRRNPMDFVCLFTTQPWPGSELWDLAVERGLIDPENLDWRSIQYDQRPILADSVDADWLNRRFYWESIRAALNNYPLPVFLGRAARALYYRLRR